MRTNDDFLVFNKVVFQCLATVFDAIAASAVVMDMATSSVSHSLFELIYCANEL